MRLIQEIALGSMKIQIQERCFQYCETCIKLTPLGPYPCLLNTGCPLKTGSNYNILFNDT